MGFPLAPILANLFMSFHESKWIDQYKTNRPLYYRRYVDDIFALFNIKLEAENLLLYLNTQHSNIKFTIEYEENGKLLLLDVLIAKKSSNRITTSVYHKKTYTGLLTNYFSFCSYSYKIGLMKTLINRTFKINSSWHGYHEDISNLKIVLRKNLFPSHIIDKQISHRLTNKVNNTDNNKDDAINNIR